MDDFERFLDETINKEKKAYAEQTFMGESQEYRLGFRTGVMFAIYEMRDQYRKKKEIE